MSSSSPFVAVVGTPRSGTSLACDLVRECGYNFGEDVLKQPGKRMARNTHAHFSLWNWADPPTGDVLKPNFAKFGVTALNVVPYFTDMLPILREMYPALKVIVATRDLRKAILSHVEYVLFEDPGNYREETTWAGRVRAAADAVESRYAPTRALLRDGEYDTFELPFAQTVRREEGLLGALAEFLGADPGTAVPAMMGQIDPSVPKYL